MSFFEAILLVASALAWLVALALFSKLSGRMKAAREKVRIAQDKLERLSKGVEEVKGVSATIREEIKQAEEALPPLQAQVDELKVRLSEAKQAAGARLIVVSDKWSASDKAWQAHVSNPEFAKVRSTSPHAAELQAGRRHVIWALTARQAQERLSARFPSTKGWHVGQVEEAPMFVIPRN